jgi:hypothetical protein
VTRLRAVREAPLPREHEFEAAHGLPEPLPASERLLWQGSPRWQPLALRAFHARKVAWYFVALAAVRVAVLAADGAAPLTMAVSALWMLLLGACAVALLVALAVMSARTAVYTITDRRVVMRVGIVLTLTFNLPLVRIAGAGLRADADGSGDIPLALRGGDRIAWLHLWPHVRPWRVSQPEPMLRGVPDVAAVARVLSDAWTARTGIAALQPAAAPAADARSSAQPALAGH